MRKEETAKAIHSLNKEDKKVDKKALVRVMRIKDLNSSIAIFYMWR